MQPLSWRALKQKDDKYDKCDADDKDDEDENDGKVKENDTYGNYDKKHGNEGHANCERVRRLFITFHNCS